MDGGNLTFEKEINPQAWKTDDHHFGLKFVGKSVPKDTKFNWTSEGRFGFPKLHDDVGLGGSLAVTCGSDKKLLGTATLVAQLMRDHTLGFNFERDLKDNSNLALQFKTYHKLNDDVTVGSMFDHFKKNLCFGAVYKVNGFVDKIGLSGTFDLNKDKDGKLGPRAFGTTIEKKLDDFNSIRIKTKIADSIIVTGVLTTKINDNVKIRLGDTIDPLAAYQNKNFNTYQWGASVDFEY